MEVLYFISYTVYGDGDYRNIINRGCTTMNLTPEQASKLGMVHQSLVQFMIIDSNENGGDFNPIEDTVSIDCISRL